MKKKVQNELLIKFEKKVPHKLKVGDRILHFIYFNEIMVHIFLFSYLKVIDNV